MTQITDIYNLIVNFIVDLLIKVGIDEEKIPAWLKEDVTVA